MFGFPRNRDADFKKVTSIPDIERCLTKQQPSHSRTNGVGGSSAPPTSSKLPRGIVRTREGAISHLMMEASMLWYNRWFCVFCLFSQWFHSAMTNVVYYYHDKLSAAQRVPLKDIAFEYMPLLTGGWWSLSEYLIIAMVIISMVFTFGLFFIRWTSLGPQGRPLYCVICMRRLLLTWAVCQFLRIISFMVTHLPGPSRQCIYDVPLELTAVEMITGRAPASGNPIGYEPPQSWIEIFWRFDFAHGCGDLMFSSHTIFSMSLVCFVIKYFPWKIPVATMVTSQILMIPLILCARKHYSVDLVTALYVTPLVFELLWIKFPDADTTAAMASNYGIRFRRVEAGKVLVSVLGKEYHIDECEAPWDFGDRRKGALAV